jgi:hypothetical protein
MRTITRGTALVVALAMLMFAFGAGTATAAPPAGGALTEQVTGTTSTGGTFVGTLDVTRFAKRSGGIVAIGTVTGEITDAAGTTTTAVPSTQVAVPVDLAATQASCEILELVLGPLNLDVLGLTIFLDTVTLLIEAVPGAGNLLGNLLCAIAGLLDGPGPLSGLLTSITSLLNQILGALG